MPSHTPVVYCLGHATKRASYVGWTNNFPRRLRQHRGELKRGAQYTTRAGPEWSPHFIVFGFPSKSEALSLEKHLHLRRGRPVDGTRRGNTFGSTPVGKRAWAVYNLLQRERFAKRTQTKDMHLRIYWGKRALYDAACGLMWAHPVTHSLERPSFI